MKKFTTLMLLSALVLTACGGTAAPAADDTTAGDTTPAPETTDLAESWGIVKQDFGGAEVCIISGEHCKYEYAIEEETGDVVDDAVYARNRKVEELLNVKFSIISQANWTGTDPFYSLIRSDVQAGDSTYDIVNGLNCWTTPLVFEGIFRRLDNISSINFDHPWWVPGIALDGSDEVYSAFSDASLSLYKDLYVMFFNQSIIEKNKMENPYDLVESGKWTLDAFLKMGREGSADLDGDGNITVDKDQMAYVAKHAANRGFLTATGTSVIVTDEKGTPKMGGVSEQLSNVYDKLRPFFTDKKLTHVDTEPDMILLSKPFIEGRALFLNNCLIAVEGMRDMKDDYGIAPLPKYDENQKDYLSQIATSTSALYLPVTVEDAEMLGSVMEALGFYSHTEVVPVYYETALNVKYARDEKVQSMLAMVRENASTNVDFSFNTIFWTNDVINAAWEDKELASWYAGLESKVNTTIEKYLAIDIDG